MQQWKPHLICRPQLLIYQAQNIHGNHIIVIIIILTPYNLPEKCFAFISYNFEAFEFKA